jgi:4-amino-4-deoxy-L-arabinose transferase-like glycosyltransferase
VSLGAVYALVTPPFEASDEFKHYPVVQYIQSQKVLPILDPDEPGLWLQEGAQPPLYYILTALLTGWIDTSDLLEVHHANPHAFVGDPNQTGNKNLIIHEPARERFPVQGTVLAVYVIRIASIGLGAGSLLLIAKLGNLMFSPKVGFFAAALTAFNPMFLFVNAAVNNDSLAILLGHWGLYLLIRLWQDAPDPRRQWWHYARLGLVLGLGILTKLSLAGLLGLAGLALAWLAWRRRQWRLFFGGGLVTLAGALAVSGWWFVRNLQVYGDPTALNAFIALQGIRDEPITWAGWVNEFGTFFRAYWGLFGGVNVAAPELFYAICNGAILIGGLGLLKWLWRDGGKAPPGIWLLPAWSGILLLLLIRWNIISPAFQGRLIFPALGAVNLLWAKGLLSWVKEKQRTRLAAVLIGLLLIVAILLPWTSIRPAYVLPAPVATIPESAQFGPITFDAGDGNMQLVGVEMLPQQSVTPGSGPVELALYWQMGMPVSQDYVSSVHLLGRELVSEGQIDRYPANGMVLTSHWQAGQIYRDLYHVYVDETAVAPSQLRVAVTVFDDEAEKALPAMSPDGTIIELLLVGEPVRLAADSSMAPVPDESLEVTFAEGITLAGYDLAPLSPSPGAEIRLTLHWRATDTPTQNYTIFVHLVNSTQTQVVGADAPPVANDYPTSLWRAGDWIDDMHLLEVPSELSSGDYLIRVGLYDPITGRRLARLDGSGDSAEIILAIGE